MANNKGAAALFLGGLAAIGLIVYSLLRKATATIQSISYNSTISWGQDFTVQVNWTVGETFTGDIYFLFFDQSKSYVAFQGRTSLTTFSPGSHVDTMTATVPSEPYVPAGLYLVYVVIRKVNKVSATVAEDWGIAPVVVS